jgi:hypothetical protein
MGFLDVLPAPQTILFSAGIGYKEALKAQISCEQIAQSFQCGRTWGAVSLYPLQKNFIIKIMWLRFWSDASCDESTDKDS